MFTKWLNRRKEKKDRQRAAQLAQNARLIADRQKAVIEVEDLHAVKLEQLKVDKEMWIKEGMSLERAGARYNNEVRLTNEARITLIDAINGRLKA